MGLKVNSISKRIRGNCTQFVYLTVGEICTGLVMYNVTWKVYCNKTFFFLLLQIFLPNLHTEIRGLEVGTPASYSKDPEFKSRLRNRLSWLRT
jgi:hypothetical protein